MTATGVGTKQLTLQDFIIAVLNKGGLPATGPNIAVLSGLALSEGRGLAGWNPFDTTQKAAGSTSINRAGVQSYTSFEQGVEATWQTLNNGLYDPLLTGLAEQQPLSYYISGPGFTSLKTWQRGPRGASNPPPAAVKVLASRTVAQLLSYAKMVTAGNTPAAPAGSGSSITPAQTFGAKTDSAPDPFGIGSALSNFGTTISETITRVIYFAVAGVLLAVGLALMFGGDIEDLVGKAMDKIPPIPVVP